MQGADRPKSIQATNKYMADSIGASRRRASSQHESGSRRTAQLRSIEDALRYLGLLPLPLLYALIGPLALLFLVPQPWYWRRIFGNMRYVELGCSRRHMIWVGLRRALYFGEQLAEWLRTPWVDTALLTSRRAPLSPEVPRVLASQQGHPGPVFLLGCHQGSFLWSMLAVRFHFAPWLQAPAVGIFQRQHGLNLRNLLCRYDRQYRADFLDSGRPFMRWLAARRRTGTPSLVFALGDNAAMPDSLAGSIVQVPMLGGERCLRRDLGAVAVNVGAPIFFLHSRRIGLGHYETSLELIGEPPYGNDGVERVLRRYAELTASAYAEAPQFSQLLLNNPRRWVPLELSGCKG